MAEHGRVVQDLGDGRAIAFDSTRRDPSVDEIFIPVIEKVSEDSVRTGRELKEQLTKIRTAERASRRRKRIRVDG